MFLRSLFRQSSQPPSQVMEGASPALSTLFREDGALVLSGRTGRPLSTGVALLWGLSLFSHPYRILTCANSQCPIVRGSKGYCVSVWCRVRIGETQRSLVLPSDLTSYSLLSSLPFFANRLTINFDETEA